MPDASATNAVLARIDELLAIPWEKNGRTLDISGEIYLGTVSVASQLFGAESPQMVAIVQAKVDVRESNWDTWGKETKLVLECRGILRALAGDVRAGLVNSIRFQAQAEVFADLLRLAKTALESGAKDTAAVLAAASLEDALKQLAASRGLEVEDQEMSTVVAALKSKGLISSAQGTLLKGFVQIRNKALHAEWSKFDTADVQSLIAFTEQFLLSRLA